MYAFTFQLIASCLDQILLCHLQLCVDRSAAEGSSPDGGSSTEPGCTAPTEVTTVPPPAAKPICNSTGDGNNTCLSCTSAPVCINSFEGSVLFGSYICGDQDPKTPHCNKGVCTAERDETCTSEQPTSSFVCTSNGYFPDPDDCQKFHFCVKSKATDFSCSDNYVYSHQRNSCVRKILSSDCAVIKCKYSVPLEYVAYPKDSSVYGLCLRGYPTVVFKCDEGEQFDTKKSNCIFVCKKEGLFPVPGSNTKYRECFSTGINKFQLYERECPAGSIFNSDIGKCYVNVRSAIFV